MLLDSNIIIYAAQPGYDWLREFIAEHAPVVSALYQQCCQVFIELGSKPTLLEMSRHCLATQVGVWLPSLCQGQTDWQQITHSLAELYVHGYAAALIQDYWVVDLKHRQLKVFREPVEGNYRSESTFTNGEICPLAFSDVRVSVQRFL